MVRARQRDLVRALALVARTRRDRLAVDGTGDARLRHRLGPALQDLPRTGSAPGRHPAAARASRSPTPWRSRSPPPRSPSTPPRSSAGCTPTSGARCPTARPYAADDPEPLRFAAVTLAHGAALGHLRYHPRPLDGSDLDDFYADWAVIGRAMGATDLPETRARGRGLPGPASHRHSRSTADTLTALRMFEGRPPRPYDLATEPVMWAARDLLPDWARQLFRYARRARPRRRAQARPCPRGAAGAAGGRRHTAPQAPGAGATGALRADCRSGARLTDAEAAEVRRVLRSCTWRWPWCA